MKHLLLLVTATLVALMAGLFYSWSVSVIPGLARVADDTYLKAMHAMNRAIQNPLFLLAFMGAVVLLPICTWQQYTGTFSGRAGLLLATTVVYGVGVFGVTVVGNVPLNNLLDAADVHRLTTEQTAALRTTFERPWVRLHTIRTVAAVVALVLVLLACLRMPEPTNP